LLLFFTPHGTVWDQWRPAGGETDFTLSPILAPLAAHRERIVIVDGIEMVSGTEYYIPHTYTMPLLWTGSPIDTAASGFCREDHGGRCFGWNTGVSVDQHIAARLQDGLPYPTIELGYGCGGLLPATRMIYSAAGTPRSPIDDPVRAFESFFPAQDPDAQAAARSALRRRSVLDAVRRDLGSRRGQLSAADRARLDAHASALRELERSLVTPFALCEAGYAEACGRMGNVYRDGKGVAQSYAKAIELYEGACTAGAWDACGELAYLLRHGVGVGKDLERAFQLAEPACHHISGVSCYVLGELYLEGLGVEKHKDRAVDYLKQGCGAYSDKACIRLRRLGVK
jgi:hypothetical protein